MPNPEFSNLPTGDEITPKDLELGSDNVVSMDEYRGKVGEAQGRVHKQVTESAASRASRAQAERDAKQFAREAINNVEVDDDYRAPSEYFPGGIKVGAATGAENLMTRAQMNRKPKKKGFFARLFGGGK